MALDDKQKGVVRGMVSAVVLVIVVLGAAIVLRPDGLLPATNSMGAGLGWVAAWLLLPGLFLLVSIGRLAGHRFHTPEDIDGSGLTAGSEKARMLQAVVQNSLEQTVLAAVVWAAYAVLLPRGWSAAIPAAAALFLAGRLLFAAGYERGAPARALGFALTFYSTVALALLAAGAGVGAILGL